MAKVRYTGPSEIHTMRSNSMPSGKEYVFYSNGKPTEVSNEDDIKFFKDNGFNVSTGPVEKAKEKIKKTKK